MKKYNYEIRLRYLIIYIVMLGVLLIGLGALPLIPRIVQVPAPTTNEMVNYLKQVTVRVYQTHPEMPQRMLVGTGTIIKIKNNATYILTNEHVAPMINAENVYVTSIDKKSYKAQVIATSNRVDLSLIKIDKILPNTRAVVGFAPSVIGERIYNMSMYLGNFYIYSEGIVGGISNDKYLIINLPTAGGSSGSGAINVRGELVGVMFGAYLLHPLQMDTARGIAVDYTDIQIFLNNITNWE
jgi:S1-C subfamily serine protease